MPKAKSVTLPEMPWDTDSRLGRGRLVPGTVQEWENGKATSHRVWRRATPRAIRDLAVDARAAVEDYAATLETVGASGGTVDPTSGGGSRSEVPTGPSLARLTAATNLRRMRRALADESVEVRPGLVVTLESLVEWAAVDGLPLIDIARRLGLQAPTRRDTTLILRGIIKASDRLAICCGYRAAPRRLE